MGTNSLILTFYSKTMRQGLLGNYCRQNENGHDNNSKPSNHREMAEYKIEEARWEYHKI